MGQSYELFCKHAFRRDASCPRDLETLARKIISTTGGLPLAVEVIGSLLCHKDEDFWKEALEKLKRVPNEKVRDKLKISYDYLEHGQQQIFLDIACLYDKSELEYASYMWKSCGFYPKEGIERLISLSLIKRVYEYNVIDIHDQLRDLGREIVRKEDRDNIGLCSRIWLEEEAEEVMQRKLGTDKVQALTLPTSRDYYRHLYVQEALHYTSEDFEGMPNLRFLQMSDVHLTGDFEKLFLNLRWLRWWHQRGSPIDIMGINFNPKKLVVLELSDSNITEYWKGWSHTKDLKVIKLSNCMNLTTTPDFSALKELEVLIVEYCSGFKKIHPSIGKFKTTLKVLKVTSCDLEELPIELGKMEELRELHISYNSSIREIPIISEGCMTKLETLQAFSCRSLRCIPDSLGSLVKLRRLMLSDCRSVTKIPESIGKLSSLVKLGLYNIGVEELPDSIGELRSLESIQMNDNPIKCLPTSIGMLSKLRELQLWECKELKSLPILPPSLTSLRFCGDSMERLPDLSNLTNLKSLQYIDLLQRRNKALNLGDLNQLETLKIGDGFKISDPAEALDMASENFSLQLELPVSLGILEVYGCQTLHTLPNFSNFKNLSKLHLHGCSELMEINGLEGAESLTDLCITRCKKLSRLGDLSYLKELRKIELTDCEKLSDVQGIEKLMSLTSLTFSRCHPKIKFLDPSMLTSLKELYIGDKELMEIPGLQELKSLEQLYLWRCMSLQHLPDLSQCTKLKSLDVWGCEKLTEIRGFENKSLGHINITGWSLLTLSHQSFLPIRKKNLSISPNESNSDFNPLESEEESKSDSNPVEESE